MRVCKKCSAEFEGKQCLDCKKISAKFWRGKNKIALQLYNKEYRQKNIESCREYDILRYKNNSDKLKLKSSNYRKSNPESVKLYQKKWNEQNKQKKNECSKLYRINNIENISAKQKIWREKNKEKLKTMRSLWRESHKNETNIYKQNRRTLSKKAGGTLSKNLFDILFKLQKGLCPACKCKLSNTKPRSHLDHIIALANGGTNTDDNMQILCQSCNNSKGVKDNLIFMQSKGYLL